MPKDINVLKEATKVRVSQDSLAASLAIRHDTTFVKMKAVVDDLFDTVQNQLELGNKVNITGFGSFQIKRNHSRKFYNVVEGKDGVTEPSACISLKPFKEAWYR